MAQHFLTPNAKTDRVSALNPLWQSRPSDYCITTKTNGMYNTALLLHEIAKCKLQDFVLIRSSQCATQPKLSISA